MRVVFADSICACESRLRGHSRSFTCRRILVAERTAAPYKSRMRIVGGLRSRMSRDRGDEPPGKRGLPFIGETAAFARDPFGFIEERLDRHGNVFSTRVLGREVVVVAGPEAVRAFIDPALIARQDAMLPHVATLFGGRSLPVLDGEEHRQRKELILEAFTPEALQDYLPLMQRTTEAAFERWATHGGEFRWHPRLKRLAFDVILRTIVGRTPRDLPGLFPEYMRITRAFATIPLALPGTTYGRGRAAMGRVRRRLEEVVRESRSTPPTGGLGRMLQSDAARRAGLNDAELATELHHLILAGFVVNAQLVSIARTLHAHPAVAERLREEILAVTPSGPIGHTDLARLPYLRAFVDEVRRLCPIVPAIFGRARQEFAFQGRTIRQGVTVIWAPLPTNVSRSVFSAPEAFNPDRFLPPAAEQHRHAFAYTPQGAGPRTGHACPGFDFATTLMSVFTIVALRGYRWDIPPQDLAVDRRSSPPELKSGLRAVVTRRD